MAYVGVRVEPTVRLGPGVESFGSATASIWGSGIQMWILATVTVSEMHLRVRTSLKADWSR